MYFTSSPGDGRPAILKLVNLLINKNYTLDDVQFSLPQINTELTNNRNTKIAVFFKSEKGFYGSKAIYYNRIHVGELPELIISRGTATTYHQVIPALNDAYNLNLTTNDLVNGPLPDQISSEITVVLPISINSYIYYGSTQLITDNVSLDYDWFRPNHTLLNYFCMGFDKFGSFSDNDGGLYNRLIQPDSSDCGYEDGLPRLELTTPVPMSSLEEGTSGVFTVEFINPTGSVTVTISSNDQKLNLSKTSFILNATTTTNTFTVNSNHPGTYQISVSNNTGIVNPVPEYFTVIDKYNTTYGIVNNPVLEGLINESSGLFTIQGYNVDPDEPITVTLTTSQGLTKSVNSVILTAAQPTRTFTVQAAVQNTYFINFTNNRGLPNPPRISYLVKPNVSLILSPPQTVFIEDQQSDLFTVSMLNGYESVTITPNALGAASVNPASFILTPSQPSGNFRLTYNGVGQFSLNLTNDSDIENPGEFILDVLPKPYIVVSPPLADINTGQISGLFVVELFNGLTNVVVTITDNVDNISTNSITLTPAQPTATFTVNQSIEGNYFVQFTNNRNYDITSRIDFPVIRTLVPQIVCSNTAPLNIKLNQISSDFSLSLIDETGPVNVTIVTSNGLVSNKTVVLLDQTTPVQTFTVTGETVGVKTISFTNDINIINPSNISVTIREIDIVELVTIPSNIRANTLSGDFSLTLVHPYNAVIVTPQAINATFTPTNLTLTPAQPTATFKASFVDEGFNVLSFATNPVTVVTEPIDIDVLEQLLPTLSLTAPTSNLYTGDNSGQFTVSLLNAQNNVTVTVVSQTDTVSQNTLILTPAQPTATFTVNDLSPGTYSVGITNNANIVNPAPVSITVLSDPAQLSFSPPTDTEIEAGQNSDDFTVTMTNGVRSVIITPVASGNNVFTPSIFSLTPQVPTATFKLSSTDVGQKTISIINNRNISNPPSIVVDILDNINISISGPDTINTNEPYHLTLTRTNSVGSLIYNLTPVSNIQYLNLAVENTIEFDDGVLNLDVYFVNNGNLNPVSYGSGTIPFNGKSITGILRTAVHLERDDLFHHTQMLFRPRGLSDYSDKSLNQLAVSTSAVSTTNATASRLWTTSYHVVTFGTDPFIDYEYIPELNIRDSNFCIEGHHKLNVSTTTLRNLFDFRGNDGITDGLTLFVDPSTRQLFAWDTAYAAENGGNIFETPINSLPATGTYFHWMFSIENGIARIFVDGVLYGQTNFNPLQTSLSGVRIGSNRNLARDFSGFCDSVRLTVGASRQINNFTPPSRSFEQIGLPFIRISKLSDPTYGVTKNSDLITITAYFINTKIIVFPVADENVIFSKNEIILTPAQPTATFTVSSSIAGSYNISLETNVGEFVLTPDVRTINFVQPVVTINPATDLILQEDGLPTIFTLSITNPVEDVVVNINAWSGSNLSKQTVTLSTTTSEDTFSIAPTNSGVFELSFSDNTIALLPEPLAIIVEGLTQLNFVRNDSGQLSLNGEASFTVSVLNPTTDIEITLVSELEVDFDNFTPPIVLNQTTTSVIFTAKSSIVGTYQISILNNQGLQNPSPISFTVSDSLPVEPTGGNVTNIAVDETNYRVHVFLEDGEFYLPSSRTVEVLVVAGGGAGGSYNSGGGGGAGGVISTTLIPNEGTHSVSVGAGGIGVVGSGHTGGNNSSVFNLIAIGGGRGGQGGSGQGYPASVGGSGGGGQGTYNGSTKPGALGTDGQGNSGGAGIDTANTLARCSGGGGGAGLPGGNATWLNTSTGLAGKGGDGIQNAITGTLLYYGGGGGGASNTTNSIRSNVGGLGGGGRGRTDEPGSNAEPNTGGGGGGSSGGYTHFKGGDGGSGIVIVRYITDDAYFTLTRLGTANAEKNEFVEFELKLYNSTKPVNLTIQSDESVTFSSNVINITLNVFENIFLFSAKSDIIGTHVINVLNDDNLLLQFSDSLIVSYVGFLILHNSSTLFLSQNETEMFTIELFESQSDTLVTINIDNFTDGEIFINEFERIGSNQLLLSSLNRTANFYLVKQTPGVCNLTISNDKLLLNPGSRSLSFIDNSPLTSIEFDNHNLDVVTNTRDQSKFNLTQTII